MARVPSSDARTQLPTAAASSKRDSLRATPKISGAGQQNVGQYDKTLAGRGSNPTGPSGTGRPASGARMAGPGAGTRQPGPASGADGSNRPRLRTPGGGGEAA
jgi:hypothetical protein